jgi:enamine deaminase RidA (YjgF/YER057c/UK114 family)
MERWSINPVPWSLKLGFDQAVLIEGPQRQLVCGGQDSVDADGNPQDPGDMAAQLELSLDNLVAVLAAADMTLANVVRLNVYTTDLHTDAWERDLRDRRRGRHGGEGRRARRRGDRPAVRRPWSTSGYAIRVTVLADPQGATFAASKFVAKNKDFGRQQDG